MNLQICSTWFHHTIARCAFFFLYVWLAPNCDIRVSFVAAVVAHLKEWSTSVVRLSTAKSSLTPYPTDSGASLQPTHGNLWNLISLWRLYPRTRHIHRWEWTSYTQRLHQIYPFRIMHIINCHELGDCSVAFQVWFAVLVTRAIPVVGQATLPSIPRIICRGIFSASLYLSPILAGLYPRSPPHTSITKPDITIPNWSLNHSRRRPTSDTPVLN